MNIEIIATLERFSELKDDWNRLLNDAIDSQIFYKWEWQYTYAKMFLKPTDELFIIAIWNNKNALLGVAPLKIVEKKIWFKKSKLLTFITDRLVDYNNFLIHKNENKIKVLKKIFDVIFEKKEWIFLKFDNINNRTDILDVIDFILKQTLSTYSSYPNVIAPYFEGNDTKFNKAQMSDIGRRERKLKEKGEIQINHFTDIEKVTFEKLIEFHKDEYKEKSIFDNPNIEDFYINLSKSFDSHILLSSLTLDNKIVAIHFGFIDKNKIYYYIPKFDKNYQKFAVGLILLQNTFEKYSTRISEFDTLRGEETYKFHWADKLSSNYTIWAVSNSHKNRVEKIYVNLFTAFKTVPFLSNIYKRIKGEE